MGGSAPVGYDVRDRRLIVNPEEAQTVRHIFERYLELGTVRMLAGDLAARGIVSANKLSKAGHARGGKPFMRGALYHLLSNPVYVGEIRHKSERHPGQHEALISRDLWDRVQTQLRSKARRQFENRETAATRSPLTGKLYDESGEPLYVQGAAKGQRRYRYYVSKSLVKGDSDDTEKGWRLSAPELEQVVSSAAVEMLSDQSAISRTSEESHVDIDLLPSILKSCQMWIDRLHPPSQPGSALAELVDRVDLSREGIRLSLGVRVSAAEIPEGNRRERIFLTQKFPMQMKRRGVEMRMVLAGNSRAVRFDRALLKAVARARRWSQQLLSRQVPSVRAIARQQRLAPRYVRDLLPLAFLSPRIVEAIAEGRQPPELTVIGITRRIELPLLWSVQEQALGLGYYTRPELPTTAEEPLEGTTEIPPG